VYPSQKKPEPPPPIIIDNEEEYEIEELMDSKFVRNKLKYLVKWRGYPNQANWTWEPEDKILRDNEDEFHENHPSAPQRVDVHQIHFKETVTQDKNPNPEWLNGKIARFDVEDSRMDAYLPLSPEHFAEMEKQNKTSEYRSYLIEDIERLWFLNTQDKLVTHMAAVETGQFHEDKRPDGTPKRKWKYPITTLYKLDTPLYPKDRCLEGQNPQGPVYTTSKPNVKMTKLWSHQHEGILKTVTNPKELEQAIETIN
jgi:hypothetical protein